MGELSNPKRALSALTEGLQILAEEVPEGVLVGNPKGAILYANRRAIEITGYDRAAFDHATLDDLIPCRHDLLGIPTDISWGKQQPGKAVRSGLYGQESEGGLADGMTLAVIYSKPHQAVRVIIKSSDSEGDLFSPFPFIIETFATITELADPCTGRHQRRVSMLSAAIARQMGLDERVIGEIRLAGMVHDLGKIRIPSEILHSQRSLSQWEYSMVQEHAQIGYDILKPVRFPAPIAEIVLQHHEMMDGSGYPFGLRGEEILPQARILAVADIVEATAADRSYRQGLGVERAWEQCAKESGRRLDAEVVKACHSVLEASGFHFFGEIPTNG